MFIDCFDYNFLCNYDYKDKLNIIYLNVCVSMFCKIMTCDRHVTKVHLLQKFLDPQRYALIDKIYYQHVEIFLDSHSREKCVYKACVKGKCVSTLIKGKHDTWFVRGLTT